MQKTIRCLHLTNGSDKRCLARRDDCVASSFILLSPENSKSADLLLVINLCQRVTAGRESSMKEVEEEEEEEEKKDED